MENRLRNIGIIAHVDAGKTTLTERILYLTGKSHHLGEVHTGDTVMDFDPEERKRGITIQSAATTVPWRGHAITLIDTPGHIDFNIEVNRALRVLDGAVVVFDGVAGVEPQTETNWRLADRYRVPRIAFVNKLDRVGADFPRVLTMMAERLGVRPVALQLPLGQEAGFQGVVDLLRRVAIRWVGDGPDAHAEKGAIPPDMGDAMAAARSRLVEAVVEQDDGLLDDWLAGREIDPEVLRAALRRATLAGRLVPVLCGAAFRNKGVGPLLDAVVDYLPAPGEGPAAIAEGGQSPLANAGDPAAPLVALAFKVSSDDHGSLTFLRLYRGTLHPGDSVENTHTGRRERVARVYRVHANKRQDLPQAGAGEIVAVTGLKDTLTGHTLCAPGHPVVLEEISVPTPVIEVAVDAADSQAEEALHRALHALVREDPSLCLRQDEETGQTLLAGMGELQLEVSLARLAQQKGLVVRTGAPRVAYRETLARAVSVRHLLRKQTGGPGQYAEVALRLEPLERGAGLQVENRIHGGVIPREFIPGVETGIRRAAQGGLLGHPVVDVRVILEDGSAHERDSSVLAFEVAAAAAFREGLEQGGTRLLEPVMAVEVVTPEEALGACIGDLNRRRGTIREQVREGGQGRSSTLRLRAEVPLARLFGYIGDLRALSAGRASYTMAFAHYGEAPRAA